MRLRVFCFITRRNTSELLIFRHRDFPGAGVQIPGGGIVPGEHPDDAALREAWEETGVSGLVVTRKICDESVSAWKTRAHVYHLTAPDDTLDAWEYVTNDYHDDAHRARGEPLVFQFSWIPIATRGCLEDPQDRWLDFLTGPETMA